MDEPPPREAKHENQVPALRSAGQLIGGGALPLGFQIDILRPTGFNTSKEVLFVIVQCSAGIL